MRGLHWDKIPGDNDDEVAARGILYLLIFQQLGQLLRWSWGLNVLLQKSTGDNAEDEHAGSYMERGHRQGVGSSGRGEYEPLMANATQGPNNISQESGDMHSSKSLHGNKSVGTFHSEQELPFGSGDQTPITNQQYTSSVSSQASLAGKPASSQIINGVLSTPANGNLLPADSNRHIKQLPEGDTTSASEDRSHFQGQSTMLSRSRRSLKSTFAKLSGRTSACLKSAFVALPSPLQKLLMKVYAGIRAFVVAIWQSMNPPLFAMAAALLVASIPSLQRLFFSDGTFVKNSITSAIQQTGGVAVPLILVVLGANLARVSDPDETLRPPSEDDKIEGKLVIASLLSRMILPTMLMAPILALSAKYLSISILDDPIFIIVCFLLAGAPSALQLAQICQINEVYMGAMTRILFHSYVIWYKHLPPWSTC
jgi:auxin efflux carrier family protein